MAKKQGTSSNQGIQATNINAQAIAVGKGAQAIVQQSRESNELNQIFAELEMQVSKLAEGSDKEIAGSAVTALKAEAQLGDKAKEENVAKWLNFLAQIAPDIWEVAVASFSNPVIGLGLAFSKVAQRAREEKGKA